MRQHAFCSPLDSQVTVWNIIYSHLRGFWFLEYCRAIETWTNVRHDIYNSTRGALVSSFLAVPGDYSRICDFLLRSHHF